MGDPQRLIRVLVGLLAVAHSLGAADIQVWVQDFTGGIVSNRAVVMTPAAPQATSGSWLVTREARTNMTDAAGLALFTNVLAGAYQVSIAGTPKANFIITVPDSASTLSAGALAVTPELSSAIFSAYSKAVSDLRYPSQYGTNIVVWTNGGCVTIAAVAGAGAAVAQGTNVVTTTNGSTVTVSAAVSQEMLAAKIASSAGAGTNTVLREPTLTDTVTLGDPYEGTSLQAIVSFGLDWYASDLGAPTLPVLRLTNDTTEARVEVLGPLRICPGSAGSVGSVLTSTNMSGGAEWRGPAWVETNGGTATRLTVQGLGVSQATLQETVSVHGPLVWRLGTNVDRTGIDVKDGNGNLVMRLTNNLGESWMEFFKPVTNQEVLAARAGLDAAWVRAGNVSATNLTASGTITAGQTPSPLSTITTDISTNPTTAHLYVPATHNAVRLWLGKTPETEAYADIYVSTNGFRQCILRMYRWTSRILNVPAGATVSIGSSTNRQMQICSMVVPGSLEALTSSGVTNLAMCDKSGPPIWTPERGHIFLPTNGAWFAVLSNNTERVIFISEYDGQTWTTPRWHILETNGSPIFRATYKQVALANYDGVPVRVAAPAGSVIGGQCHVASLVPRSSVRTWYCASVPDFLTACTNAVCGDTIALADGAYALTCNATNWMFVSNNACGFTGMEGITIRGLSGDRNKVILSGDATNTGMWALLFTQFKTWTPACFANLTFDCTNATRYVSIDSGNYVFENCLFTGISMSLNNLFGAGNSTSQNATKVSLLWCEGRYAGADVFSTSGDNNVDYTMVGCAGYEPGTQVNDQVVTAHYTASIKCYGCRFWQAVRDVVACQNDLAPVFLFFCWTGAGTNKCGLWNLYSFACRHQNDDGSNYGWATNSYELFDNTSREHASINSGGPFPICWHNRIAPTSSPGYGWYVRGVGTPGDFMGNIIRQPNNYAVLMNYGANSNSFRESVLNCTFTNCDTAIWFGDAVFDKSASNNACAGNGTSFTVTAGTMGLVYADYNVLDATVGASYTAGSHDTVNADAALTTRLFPVAGGNCDTNA